MTELLEKAIACIRTLSSERRDDIARALLSLIDAAAVYPLTPEEKASLAESCAQAARGEFATDEEVRAVWAKHGL